MYALVEIKGKQYKAAEGSLLKVDKFDTETGKQVEFDSVLLVSDEKKVQVGQPYVKGVKVKAVVEEHGKDKKILVFKYKKRKNYRRTQGHRQQFTLLRVQEISGA
ncbi:MAG: 50S ribosomal protein L21 [Spirochaetia bacterium]|jgi:large subunit ribosomal protein L21|nr:50S ribosomal protein L21 [Spirochaetales bacterium]